MLGPSLHCALISHYVHPANDQLIYLSCCGTCRGGPGASTHVEILGNEPMLLDLMKIAAGQGDGMEEVYHSDIRHFASRIPWDELG